MDRERLTKLLRNQAHDAYWHGEDSGEYGEPYPDTQEEVENEIWNEITFLKKIIRAQNALLIAYRLGRPHVQEWVFDTLDKAKEKYGLLNNIR